MLHDALNNLTVIDFTHVGAGPTCTMLMADLGARAARPGLGKTVPSFTASTETSSASALT
ncbi:CoA transferase [Rhizobium mongolense]|uniref:CoA transferase n=1 Tax=Rhizobium mongolense TaxID=57676 RepID=UPI0035578333